MDLLIVARQTTGIAPTEREITDPADALTLMPNLPHGQIVGALLSRLSLGAMVLSDGLDRIAARAAIGVAVQRSRPKGLVVLGEVLSHEILGDALPMVGGIRMLHGRPVAGLARAKQVDIETLLGDLCQRAHVSWAPASSRAVAARSVLRTDDAEAQATTFIEQQRWQAAVDVLLGAEPLATRGTNMLGRALLQLGDREGARHAFERTLGADPSNAIAKRQLGNL